MKTISKITSVFLMILFLSVNAFGQQKSQQQQQQMQQQMQQAQQMMQKMNQLQERAQKMNQEMNKKMEQTQNEQLRNQYQNMYRFGEQLALTIGTMKNAAERCNLMLQDQEMLQDREMRQEMERLRLHLNDMTGKAEEALTAMDQIRLRLQEQEKTTQSESE